jgi:D-serine deaminase-like pyridoxal phosphate-dependent protein
MDRMPTKDLPDTTLDRAAAEQQASRIKAFWAAKGQEVNVWVEVDHRAGQPLPLLVVRSDILTVTRKVR